MKKKNKLPSLQPRLGQAPDRLAQGDSWRADKGQSSTARGYGYEWQQARAAFLMDNPLCVMCKARGQVAASAVVDHITPHRGDMVLFWDRSNWQALCQHCHNSRKQSEDRKL